MSAITDRERRLRVRIDVLTRQRDGFAEKIARRETRRLNLLREPRGRPRHCPYCGRGCYGATCPAHDDLPALERQWMEALA